MRPGALISLLCLAACTQQLPSTPSPNSFYFPTGLHVAPGATPGSDGTLYVVSANFDRRYDNGIMTAVDLSAVGLPPFGGPYDSGTPLPLTDLKVDGGPMMVALANFGADLGVWPLGDGGLRLYVPSRAEGQKLMAIEARGARLDCVAMSLPDAGAQPTPANARDCGAVGASLVEHELSETGVPRADSPMSAAVSSGGLVWVTSGRQADSPRFSQTAYNDYVVRMPVDKLRVEDTDFLGLGPGSTHAVVSGKRWTYFSGRFPGSVVNPPLVRMVDDRVTADAGYAVIFPNLEADLHIGDARGIALSSDERRLYLAGRQVAATGSDVLVIGSIVGAEGDSPVVTLSRIVPLPAEPQMVRALSRGPGRADLVLVVCSSAGVLVIYDDERGDIVAQVEGVGLQPGSFTVDPRPNGARVYVSNFTDGRVAVIDLPDLDAPQGARVVARLGSSQVCLTRGLNCDAGVSP